MKSAIVVALAAAVFAGSANAAILEGVKDGFKRDVYVNDTYKQHDGVGGGGSSAGSAGAAAGGSTGGGSTGGNGGTCGGGK